ncbi:ABC transporter permease [uncultured Prevotella sp.]|uniref:ABC transporter permease n=1 Tax=uncultured Prevotella sp. TaxID=159272 RepID=UPI0027E31E2D|nr:ABC transporter permease [uncultured Prevotella sp.]
MNLVWKLLRQHISVPQFIGFFFANLFGVMIILFGFQFYNDVVPVFTSGDSFMKNNYLIVSKTIGTANALSGQSNTFANSEIDELKEQKFVSGVGRFTSAAYKVDATMGVKGVNILNSELFLESVPDKFVDVPLDKWQYDEGSKTVPIILPRSYITMYNFGFAQSRSLPKISEGLVGMVDFTLFVHGNGKEGQFKGRVIGFSSRLNSILVPQSFMEWSNKEYSADIDNQPTRLIVEVDNPTDSKVTTYMENHGYDTADNNTDAEKITYFLKLLVSIVMVVGLVISVLSFYILMLSIYLLVQKNSTKLENLLLIGYSPASVALPYQILTLALNLSVLVIALVALVFARNYYLETIAMLFPEISEGTMLGSVLLGLALFAIVSLLNIIAIRHKITSIWRK